MKQRLFALFASIGVAFVAAQAHAIEADPRPFRTSVYRMAPEYDFAKPLAAQDGAGWVINSGVFVGAFSPQWVGGYSMQLKRVTWWLRTPEQLTTPPGSFGSWVTLGFRDGTIKKVEALTGKVVWSVNLDSFSEREFLLAGTTLYVITAAQVVYALDFQTGKTLWLFDAGFPERLAIRAGVKPILNDGKIIFGISSGEILAVNAQTGKLLWRYNPEYTEARFHDVVGELVMRNNKLLITRYDGLVASLEMSGTARTAAWKNRLPGLTTSTFRNGRLYVGSINGDVYAFDGDSGREVWRTNLGETISTNTAHFTII